MRRPLAIGLMLAVCSAAGCAPARNSGASDKAGGSRSPVVLRLANSNNNDQPDTDAVEHFAAQVAKLSHGSLRVDITFLAAGAKIPRVEARTIRMVRAGRYDLGWVGARAWDEVGVRSFQALQAPFLITSTRLLNRVVTSPLAQEMLDGIRSQDVVGLALVPDFFRHPVGMKRPLATPEDFRHARMRIQPSDMTAAIFRAFGSTPLEISNDDIGYAFLGGRVDGQEVSLANSPGASIATLNITLFPKALTLFIRRAVLDRLSDDERAVLRAAATSTVRYAVERNWTDNQLAQHFCFDKRRIVLATAADLATLRREVEPVYAQLRSDPRTRRFVRTIKTWKRTLPRDPPLRVPAECRRPQQVPPAVGALRDPSLVNGTYRWVLTKKDAYAYDPRGPHPGDPFPMVGVAVLRDGHWRFPPSTITSDNDRGSYTIRGDRITFDWPRTNSVLNFTFTRDGDGTLNLTPVLPMDPGDQFVWAYRPWRRIGPPHGSL